jgi:hypothetical protein
MEPIISALRQVSFQIMSREARAVENSDICRKEIMSFLARQAARIPYLIDIDKGSVFLLNWLTRQISFSAMQELSPSVLVGMVDALGNIISSWGTEITGSIAEAQLSQDISIAAAIRAEKKYGGRVDVGRLPLREPSITDRDYLAACKSLISIYYRTIPEVVSEADRNISGLLKIMPQWQEQIKKANGHNLSKELRTIVESERILKLRGLSRDYALSLDQFISVAAEVFVNLGVSSEQTSVVEVVVKNSQMDENLIEKIFAWCALHFPGTGSVKIRSFTSNSQNHGDRACLTIYGSNFHEMDTAKAYSKYLLKEPS